LGVDLPFPFAREEAEAEAGRLGVLEEGLGREEEEEEGWLVGDMAGGREKERRGKERQREVFEKKLARSTALDSTRFGRP